MPLRRFQAVRGQCLRAGATVVRTCATLARSCSGRPTSRVRVPLRLQQPRLRRDPHPPRPPALRGGSSGGEGRRACDRHHADRGRLRLRRIDPCARALQRRDGLKPGRWWSVRGPLPPEQSMSIQLWSEIGPMARYVDDLQLLLRSFAQADPRPTRTWCRATSRAQARDASHRDLRRGRDLSRRSAIREAVRSAGRALEDAGHEVVEESPPNQPRCGRCSVGRACGGDVPAVADVRAPRGRAVAADPRVFRRREGRRSISRPTCGSCPAAGAGACNGRVAGDQPHRRVPDRRDRRVPDRDRGARDRRPRVRGDRPVLDGHLRERHVAAGRCRAGRPHRGRVPIGVQGSGAGTARWRCSRWRESSSSLRAGSPPRPRPPPARSSTSRAHAEADGEAVELGHPAHRISTPGIKDSREIESWRTLSVWPTPPKRTSW